MKMMKWALLGGAALAVTATAARADDLSALKAQIEALQTRVSQLEAQPSAAQPSAAGFSLLAIRDGQGTFEGVLPEKYGDHVRDDQGFTLSVMPTADVAPVAEVSVSGEIRTLLLYTDPDDGDDSLDVANRGRIFVKGKIDTAVGEVGGYFRLEANGGGNFTDYDTTFKANKAYGWWKFAPEWELMAGVNDMTAAITTTYDWNVSSVPVTVGPSDAANEQFRLTYTSGPLAFAIGIEDPDNFSVASTTHIGDLPGTCQDDNSNGVCDPGELPVAGPISDNNGFSGDKSDLPNLQASLTYSSDAFTAQIVGVIQDDDFGATDWAVGGGATLGIAEHFTLVAGAVVGEGTALFTNNLGPATEDDQFWGGSVGIIANIAEDTRLEIGAGIEDYDEAGEADGVNAGIFWDPVSQVTVALGGTWLDYDSDAEDLGSTDTLEVWFGTYLRFP
jgi:hypothetical protein